MALVTLTTPNGSVTQRSLPTPEHKTILTALDLPEPPRYFEISATTSS